MAVRPAVAGRPPEDAAALGSAPRCPRAGALQRSPRLAARARTARATRMPAPPRGPRAGTAGQIRPGIATAPPAAALPAWAAPRALPPSPSTGAALWRAAASTPFGRPSSPCVHGSRASSRAGDGSVGTSASRLPPSAHNAHSLPILQRRSRPRQAPPSRSRGCRPVAALENPVLWWAARGRPACERRVKRRTRRRIRQAI
jgi:hypothetical protein